MIPTDEELRKELEGWKNTKWKNNCTLKGVGADCGGFIIGVGKKFGWFPEYFKPVWPKGSWSNGELFVCNLEPYFDRYSKEESLHIGDVVVFKLDRKSWHVGIVLGGNQLAHCRFRFGFGIDSMPGWEIHSIWRPRNV